MVLEKRFRAVSPQLLTSNGGTRGELTISDTSLFKVKQKIKLNGAGLDTLELEVKRIESQTLMLVGPQSPDIREYSDVSSYTLAAGSFVIANEQSRPKIPFEEFMRAMYMEEPVSGLRSMLVDRHGDTYESDNPFPVQLSDGSINIGTVNGELAVQLTHLDNDPDAGDVADSVRVGDGTNTATVTDAGFKKALDINIASSTGASTIVRDSDGDILEINPNGTAHVEVHGDLPDGSDAVLPISGIVASNSTNTPLGIGEEFVGDFIDCSKYSSIVITILTDQFSSIDGARVEFSTDGTIANISKIIKATVPPSPSDGIFFSIPCEGRFFRIVYENGSVAQTVFKLQTLLKNSDTGAAAVPLIAELSDLTSTPLNRSVITGRGTAGHYINKRSSDVSDINSTNIPLVADEEFVGDFEQCLGFANLSLTIASDAISAINGVIVEWSTDGINVDKSDRYSVLSPFSDSFSYGIIAKFFRIRYINGPNPQSFFRLQTILHTERPKPSSHRIDNTISGENDAELVKAVLTGKDPNDMFVNKSASGVAESNTSTAPLLANEEFVGDFIDLKNYGGISVAVDSDQNGELFIEGSSDGITASNIVASLSVIAGDPFFIGASPRRRFARVRYVNGPIDQGSFDLQTIVTVNQLSPSSQPINSQLSGSSIATTSRSIIAGQREDGEFDNVDLSNSSSVKVAITDRPSEVRGRTRVLIPINDISLSGTPTIVHTVTPGKTLYVSSFLVNALNTSATEGVFQLRSGTSTVIGFLIPSRVSGSSPSAFSSASPSLPEPIPFTTNVNYVSTAGTIRASGYLIGYEEDN